MKVHIELVRDLPEDEVLIRCCHVDDTIQKIQQFISEQTELSSKMVFYKNNQEFHLPLRDILFFETESEVVYAHTANDSYKIKYRLYELEKLLPHSFVRISKSTILNINLVFSITRNITSSSLVQFMNTHKQVYVSRHYYKNLKQRLNERSTL
ncbi:MAG: LytTR family DNA-binding domain-containing protein [Bacillota bacterium]|nr:LytTR family DNA-binding domain-containing protein [Bacillota bacterium]